MAPRSALLSLLSLILQTLPGRVSQPALYIAFATAEPFLSPADFCCFSRVGPSITVGVVVGWEPALEAGPLPPPQAHLLGADLLSFCSSVAFASAGAPLPRLCLPSACFILAFAFTLGGALISAAHSTPRCISSAAGLGGRFRGRTGPPRPAPLCFQCVRTYCRPFLPTQHPGRPPSNACPSGRCSPPWLFSRQRRRRVRAPPAAGGAEVTASPDS